MDQNVVGWFEIYVEDMNRAKKFYETVLNKQLINLPMPEGEGEMWAFPWIENGPNAAGALVKHELSKPSSTGTLVYFACEDCSKELELVKNNGGKINAPKFSIGEFGFIGIASDTEGNKIGFHSQK